MNAKFLRPWMYVLLISVLLAGCGGGGGDGGNVPGAPVADAGEDQTVQPGQQVELWGDGTDEDGGIAEFAWAQTGGTTVTLEHDGSGYATFTAPTTGEEDIVLTFELTVIDDEDKEDTDTVQITVAGQTTPPGFAILGNDVNDPTNFVVSNGKAFFVSLDEADTGINAPDREQVWITDGTSAGTRMVVTLGEGDTSGNALILAAFKNGVVFTGYDGTVSGGLWFTDGTEAGTYLIKDITTSTSENIFFVGVGGDYFYFTVNDGVHGRELWASDGTPEGTHMIVDLNAAGDSNIERAAAATYWDGHFYVFAWYYLPGTFTAYPQLYRTDGTAGNFVQLTNNTVPGSVLLDYDMIVFNDTLFFTWRSSINGEELWTTDGTPGGTRLFANVAPEHSGYTYGSWPTNFHVLGDAMLFFAYEDGTGSHKSLFKTDGTEAGTQLVASVDLGVLTENMVEMNGKYYFPGRSHNMNQYSLWSTDGTSGGTQQISAVRPENSEFDQRMTVLGNKVIFPATDGVNGWEPWVSDGTAGGTIMLKNLNVGGDGFTSGGGRFTVRNGKAYFVGAQADEDFHLYETDGTTAGTQVIAPADATVTSGPLGQDGWLEQIALQPPTPINGVLVFNANFHGKKTLYKY